MTLTVEDLRTQLNITDTSDDGLLTRLLAVATKQVERQLGFALSTMDGGAPADLEHAVLMLAADHYENREASIAGVGITPIPFGVRDIINEYRNFSFGLGGCDG